MQKKRSTPGSALVVALCYTLAIDAYMKMLMFIIDKHQWLPGILAFVIGLALTIAGTLAVLLL